MRTTAAWCVVCNAGSIPCRCTVRAAACCCCCCCVRRKTHFLPALRCMAQVVVLLNEVYTLFDQLVEKHNLYKVETIGEG